jgi:hypothetical protein
MADSQERTRCWLSKMAQGLQTWSKDHKYNCGEPGMCEQECNMQLAGELKAMGDNSRREDTIDLTEMNLKSPQENAIEQKNCQQAINGVKSIKQRWKTAMEAGASPGAVVSLKVDYRTQLHAQGLVGIVYEVKQDTGGKLVCCEHGVITHDGSKGNYWVSYDKYKIVAQRNATMIPIPPKLQAIHDMVLPGAYKPENQKRILYSKLHEKQLDSMSPIKRNNGWCKCKNGKCTNCCVYKRQGNRYHSGCSCNGNCC